MLLITKTSRHSGDVEIDVTVRAGETVASVNRLVLEVVNEGKAQITYVPITLLG